jgi:DNA-binding transcriptional ArsR family regulator
MSDIFDVIADESRREILALLLERSLAGKAEMSVSDLVTKTGLSQPTVSKQLKVLRESGLVAVREDGQHRLYHLDATPLEQLEAWVVPFLGSDILNSSEQERERVLGEDVVEMATSVGRTAATAVHKVSGLVDLLKQKLG